MLQYSSPISQKCTNIIVFVMVDDQCETLAEATELSGLLGLPNWDSNYQLLDGQAFNH